MPLFQRRNIPVQRRGDDFNEPITLPDRLAARIPDAVEDILALQAMVVPDGGRRLLIAEINSAGQAVDIDGRGHALRAQALTSRDPWGLLALRSEAVLPITGLVWLRCKPRADGLSTSLLVERAPNHCLLFELFRPDIAAVLGVSDGLLNTCLNRLDTLGIGARDSLAGLANIVGPDLDKLVA